MTAFGFFLRCVCFVVLATGSFLSACSSREDRAAGPSRRVGVVIELPPLPNANERSLTGVTTVSAQPTALALALRISDGSGRRLLTRNLDLAVPYVELELTEGSYVAEAEILATSAVDGQSALCSSTEGIVPQFVSSIRQPFKVGPLSSEIVLAFSSFESPVSAQDVFMKIAGDASQIAGYTFLQNLSQQPILDSCATKTSSRPYRFFSVTSPGLVKISDFPFFTNAPLTLALVSKSGSLLAVERFSATASATDSMFASFNPQTLEFVSTGLEGADFDGDELSNAAEVAAGRNPIVADSSQSADGWTIHEVQGDWKLVEDPDGNYYAEGVTSGERHQLFDLGNVPLNLRNGWPGQVVWAVDRVDGQNMIAFLMTPDAQSVHIWTCGDAWIKQSYIEVPIDEARLWFFPSSSSTPAPTPTPTPTLPPVLTPTSTPTALPTYAP